MRVGICVFDETLTQPKTFHIPTLMRDYQKALGSAKLLLFSSIWGTCSAVGYCFSAAAPQIANQYLNLSAAGYGYWNTLNILGMLVGGLSARGLMQCLSVPRVIVIGYIGSGLALISLGAMLTFNHQNTFWFFASSSLLYCCSSYLFAGGSYLASNAIPDKASASSMMSFINMGVATLSVVVMGYLSADPFYSFLGILSGIFCITFILFLLFSFKK